MDNYEEKVRYSALLRVAAVFRMQPNALSANTRFGDDLKASFVSDFRANEFEQLDRDIRDVADRGILRELGTGALVIKTVGDYCEHMVRCYRINPNDVSRVLQLKTSKV